MKVLHFISLINQFIIWLIILQRKVKHAQKEKWCLTNSPMSKSIQFTSCCIMHDGEKQHLSLENY